MKIEIELKAERGSSKKAEYEDYLEAAAIIRRQLKAELGWEAITEIDDDKKQED
jgi:uncharacterized protein YqgQ